MNVPRNQNDIANPFQKIFILIGALTLIWFFWEQWDIGDFFYPEYWVDEGKERASLLLIVGCICGLYIFRDYD